MSKYDCLILYNKSDDPLAMDYWSAQANHRDEVFAVEASLKELGFAPYVLEIERVDKEFISALLKISPKFIFNLCESLCERSEMEMYVAALLELFAFPYTGSPPFALGLALDKAKVKQILLANGIPTPRYCVIPEGGPIKPNGTPFPALVKPVHEDASIGIRSESVVQSDSALQRQVDFIHRTYNQAALVEEFIDGREINVSILGGPEPTVLPISEISFCNFPPQEPRIVSYKAKWNPDSTFYQGTIPICPAKLAPKTETRIREIALRGFQQVGCRDYARIDIRLDKRNNPYVLEVNANPDISPVAGFARSAQAAGLSYTDLIGKIVEFTLARSNRDNKLVYA